MTRSPWAGAASRDGGGAHATAAANGESVSTPFCASTATAAHATNIATRTTGPRRMLTSARPSGRLLGAGFDYLRFEIGDHLLRHHQVLALLELLHEFLEIGQRLRFLLDLDEGVGEIEVD